MLGLSAKHPDKTGAQDGVQVLAIAGMRGFAGAAAQFGLEGSARWLIGNGAHVNAVTEDTEMHNNGRTALHYAAASGSLPLIRLLVEHGASTDARDTALDAVRDRFGPAAVTRQPSPSVTARPLGAYTPPAIDFGSPKTCCAQSGSMNRLIDDVVDAIIEHQPAAPSAVATVSTARTMVCGSASGPP